MHYFLLDFRLGFAAVLLATFLVVLAVFFTFFAAVSVLAAVFSTVAAALFAERFAVDLEVRAW